MTITWAALGFDIGLLFRGRSKCRLAKGVCDLGRIIRMAADETFIELTSGFSLTGCCSKSTAITDPVPVDEIEALDMH